MSQAAPFIFRRAKPATEWLLGNLAGGLAVLAFALSADALAQRPNGLEAIWLPAGFAVGLLVRGGFRLAPGLFIGVILAALTGREIGAISVVQVAAAASAVAVNAVLAARIDRASAAFGWTGAVWRHVDWRRGLAFALVSGCCALFYVAIVTTGHRLFGDSHSQYHGSALSLGLSYFFGIMTVTPLVMISNALEWRQLCERSAQAMIWLAGLVLFAAAMLALSGPEAGRILMPVPLILVGWAALSFGRIGTAIGILALSLLLRWATERGYGPFADMELSTADAVIHMRLFILAAVAFGWVIIGMAERRLTAEREKLIRDQGLAGVNDGVLITDAARHIVYGNDGFERITGYRLADLIGRDAKVLLGADHGADTIAEMDRCFAAGQAFAGDILNYRKDGTSFWNALSVTPVRDASGKLIRLIAILRDVTERVEAEKALAEALQSAKGSLHDSRNAEARYAAILESAMVGIISVDRLGRIVTYNREAEAIFGYTALEMIGQSLDRLLPAGMADRHESYLAQFAASNVHRRLMSNWRKVRAQRKDGAEFPMLAVLSKVEVEGSLTMTIIFRDMTEIVAREEALERLASEKEIEAEKAQTASIAKSHFLANMSHELRTPLNAIIGFSELIAGEQLGPVGNRAYVDFAKDIDQSGHLLLGLINDILDLSRIEAGKYDLHLTELDPLLVIDDALSRMRARAKAAGVTLDASPITGDCLIRADAQAVNQILTRLLCNAIKFTPAGGRVSVGMQVHHTSGRAEIDIIDNGRGIPADRLADIVLPFEQVADVYARDVGGMGLGLAICNALAEAQSGEIAIESALGRGTTVRLFLPLAAESIST
ncbi:MAG TPA: PAS domain S-box protein [Dongiaceae bacterium]|nr:PAS domain S-box protein [Dongiaceae bacterium]